MSRLLREEPIGKHLRLVYFRLSPATSPLLPLVFLAATDIELAKSHLRLVVELPQLLTGVLPQGALCQVLSEGEELGLLEIAWELEDSEEEANVTLGSSILALLSPPKISSLGK